MDVSTSTTPLSSGTTEQRRQRLRQVIQSMFNNSDNRNDSNLPIKDKACLQQECIDEDDNSCGESLSVHAMRRRSWIDDEESPDSNSK